jgi:uncharacterized protein with PIN domain
VLRVKVKNFQSISDTSFDIDGFTVIVGKNNKGKSAIVRSIDAALSNRLGNNFIKWGKLETQVNLKKDNLDITWTKGDSASYNIKLGDDVEGKPYTSLKGAVPTPITDAGFRKLEISDEKLNPLIAHQFEELFLINRSGPFVTETLSTLYDLNVINDADILCQKKLRASKSLLKTRQADVDLISNKLERFKGLDDVKIQLEVIKAHKKRVDELKNEIIEIENLSRTLMAQVVLVNKLKDIKSLKIPSLKKLSEKISDYQWIIQSLLQYNKLKDTDTLLKNVKSIKIPNLIDTKQKIADYQWIVIITKDYQKTDQEVNKLKGLSSIEIPKTQKAGDLIQEVQTLIKLTGELKTNLLTCEKCKNGLSDLKDLSTLKRTLKTVEDQVQDLKGLTILTDEYIPLVQSVKEIKDQHQQAKINLETSQKQLEEFQVCPLCKTPLTKLEHTNE